MRTIKAVKVLCPEYMSGDFASKVLSLHKRIEEVKDIRDKAFMQMNLCDKELEELTAKLGKFSGLYELEYDETVVKEFVKGEAPGIIESNGTVHV